MKSTQNTENKSTHTTTHETHLQTRPPHVENGINIRAGRESADPRCLQKKVNKTTPPQINLNKTKQ